MTKRILVPVDGSSQADQAFQYSLDEYSDAEIILMHVIEPVNMMAYSDGQGGYLDIEGYRQAEETKRKEAREMMEQYRNEAAETGIEIETQIKVGSPVKHILKEANKRCVDHIILGIRGRSVFGQVIFGSVTETVTQRSPVPVTIVRNEFIGCNPD